MNPGQLWRYTQELKRKQSRVEGGRGRVSALLARAKDVLRKRRLEFELAAIDARFCKIKRGPVILGKEGKYGDTEAPIGRSE